jgi:predicted regulator of Ras-like GTPase activity (Roadblock/LC7/MglB family)
LTDFADILQALVERIPGALGAIFVDWEGETVGTYSFDMPTLDLQIIGAQWGMVWALLQRSLAKLHMGAPVEMVVDGEHGSVLVHQVTEQYWVVLAAKRDTHLATAQRELARSVASLRAEM